jgi:K+-sensing histidine kinase KdpD
LKESFATIKTELARLHSVVEDYLSLARVPNVRRELIAVGAMLEAIVQEQQAQATARRVTLHLEGTQTLGHAALHLFTFRRAVLNLLVNALEAMPNGGHLTLAGQRTVSHLVLTVQDTGWVTAESCHGCCALIYHRPGTGLACMWCGDSQSPLGHGEASSTQERTIFTLRLPGR